MNLCSQMSVSSWLHVIQCHTEDKIYRSYCSSPEDYVYAAVASLVGYRGDDYVAQGKAAVAIIQVILSGRVTDTARAMPVVCGLRQFECLKHNIQFSTRTHRFHIGSNNGEWFYYDPELHVMEPVIMDHLGTKVVFNHPNLSSFVEAVQLLLPS